MNTTPALGDIERTACTVLAYADARAYMADLRGELARDLADPLGDWRDRHVKADMLRTLAAACSDFCEDTLMLLAQEWALLDGRHAGMFAARLTGWAIRCGDIGEPIETEEGEEEPLYVPWHVPERTPEEVPA